MSEHEEPFSVDPKDRDAPDSEEQQLADSEETELSLDEFIEALSALTRSDMRSLKVYATLKMMGIRGIVFDTDAEDLLQESILRTLQGKRKWNRAQVDVKGHLRGCTRSIASERIERAQREQDALQSSEQNPRINEFDDHSVIEVLERISVRLLKDKIAAGIFDRLREGHTRSEICDTLHLPAKVYDAARKRITRCLIAEWRRK